MSSLTVYAESKQLQMKGRVADVTHYLVENTLTGDKNMETTIIVNVI